MGRLRFATRGSSRCSVKLKSGNLGPLIPYTFEQKALCPANYCVLNCASTLLDTILGGFFLWRDFFLQRRTPVWSGEISVALTEFKAASLSDSGRTSCLACLLLGWTAAEDDESCWSTSAWSRGFTSSDAAGSICKVTKRKYSLDKRKAF